jgi:hypothetical protein
VGVRPGSRGEFFCCFFQVGRPHGTPHNGTAAGGAVLAGRSHRKMHPGTPAGPPGASIEPESLLTYKDTQTKTCVWEGLPNDTPALATGRTQRPGARSADHLEGFSWLPWPPRSPKSMLYGRSQNQKLENLVRRRAHDPPRNPVSVKRCRSIHQGFQHKDRNSLIFLFWATPAAGKTLPIVGAGSCPPFGRVFLARHPTDFCIIHVAVISDCRSSSGGSFGPPRGRCLGRFGPARGRLAI